MSKLTKNK